MVVHQITAFVRFSRSVARDYQARGAGLDYGRSEKRIFHGFSWFFLGRALVARWFARWFAVVKKFPRAKSGEMSVGPVS